MRSDIKYAKSGDVHIAYRVFGEGPRDLVLIPGTLSHAELYWEFPVNEYLLKEAHVLRSRHRLRQAWPGALRSCRRADGRSSNAPSRRDDTAFVEWFARLERASASPGAILALMRANYGIDVRHVLSAIQAPTLILHRVGDRTVPVEAGRYLAQHIGGARYVELPGDDHLLQAFDQETLDLLIDEIEEFVTGTRSGPDPDRVLVTVMFTDIVGSTERAAAVGDRRWREALEGYVGVARRQLERFRGREVDVAARSASRYGRGFTPGSARSRDQG